MCFDKFELCLTQGWQWVVITIPEPASILCYIYPSPPLTRGGFYFLNHFSPYRVCGLSVPDLLHTKLMKDLDLDSLLTGQWRILGWKVEELCASLEWRRCLRCSSSTRRRRHTSCGGGHVFESGEWICLRQWWLAAEGRRCKDQSGPAGGSDGAWRLEEGGLLERLSEEEEESVMEAKRLG